MSYRLAITINDLDTSQITDVSRYFEDRTWPWMLDAFICAMNGMGFQVSMDTLEESYYRVQRLTEDSEDA